MSLVVEVLPVDPLPVVRARVEAVGQWVLTGTADGESWEVAKGSGAAWVSDPWAPLNRPVTYLLTAAGQSWTDGPVARTYRGDQVLTDLQGRGVVDFRWFAGGGAPRAVDPRHVFFDVPGESLSSFLSAPVAGAGGGSLTARTTGVDTKAMEALLARNVPVVLLHNHVWCQIRGCDTPSAQTVLLTAAPSDRTGRTDRVQREWQVAYRPIPAPWGYLPPVATGDDLRARFQIVGDVKGSGLTVGEVTAGDWLVDW